MSLYAEIEKQLGAFRLRVRLEAGEETLALLGASGCGKSVTLQCIAGILKPDRGRIVVDGATLFDAERRVNLPPQERRVGLLFQNYALFPNMTVRQNILAGAHRQRQRPQREARAERLMERFGLTEAAGQYPAQLSGGQQQRTALARLLASEPRVLLLDEPFSAVDAHLRAQLAREVREAARDFGGTAVFVSHDREEVYRMADRVAVMERGRVSMCADKRTVFTAPQTRAAAQLTGWRNLSRVTREAGGPFAADWGLPLPLLPEDAAFVAARTICPGPGENELRCRVTGELENPASVTVFLLPEGAATPLTWELEPERWSRLRAECVTVHLPARELLPLRDEPV